MIHNYFAEKIELIGEPSGGRGLDQSTLNQIREVFPRAYVDFLGKYGFGNYFDKGYQFCDSRKFRSLAALIFKADPDFSHNDCHMAAFNASGLLHFWSQRHGLVSVDLLRYTMTCNGLTPVDEPLFLPPGLSPPTQATPDDDQRSVGLLPLGEEESRELWDWQDAPMFRESVRKCGPLMMGECFGFVPSLGMTGFESRQRTVDNVQKFDALTHFTLIAQLRNFNLVTRERGREVVVREIG